MGPLDQQMTGRAVANQVLKPIGRFPVASKRAKGYYVVNVQFFQNVSFGCPASLASVFVSCSSLAALALPILAAVVGVSSGPAWAVRSTHVIGYALPLSPAAHGAEGAKAESSSTGQPLKRRSAKVANIGGPFQMLRVVFAGEGMLPGPTKIATAGAKSVCQPRSTARFALNSLPAFVTGYTQQRATRRVAACESAELLLRVVPWRHKLITAMRARLGRPFRSRYIGTHNRTETDPSIGSFFDRLATSFASLHVVIIP